MYIVHLSFYGTGVHGWQIQKNTPDTFQEYLRKAFVKIFKSNEIPNPCGCSRTDVDVHALEFIATIRAVIDIPCEALEKGLNSLLPHNIRVKKVERVHGFRDARALVSGKHYRYLIYTGPILPPFLHSLVWHSRYGLDTAPMRKAAAHFVGTHDFASFQAADACVKTTVRTIHDIRVSRHGHIVMIDVKGDGFLKHMVRIIAGTLVEVSKKRIHPDEIPSIIHACDRHHAGLTLPGKGLYLYKLFKSEDEIAEYAFPDFHEGMIWEI